jgi:hypothetical protein
MVRTDKLPHKFLGKTSRRVQNQKTAFKRLEGWHVLEDNLPA